MRTDAEMGVMWPQAKEFRSWERQDGSLSAASGAECSPTGILILDLPPPELRDKTDFFFLWY
jgi:hypothetical protein